MLSSVASAGEALPAWRVPLCTGQMWFPWVQEQSPGGTGQLRSLPAGRSQRVASWGEDTT